MNEATLSGLAKSWHHGDEQTKQGVEKLLAENGWEIGLDEADEENPGVFVVKAGDNNGRSFMNWTAEELAQ